MSRGSFLLLDFFFCGSVPSLPVINPEVCIVPVMHRFCLRRPRPPLWSGPSLAEPELLCSTRTADGCGRIIQVIKAGLFSSNKLLRKRRWSSDLNLDDQDPSQAVKRRTETSFIWSHKCFWKPSERCRSRSFQPDVRKSFHLPCFQNKPSCVLS